ncbi:MAG TPA: hypothetical protein VEC93_16220, partial [Anaerolineae bacterium]|nr:hypothetical protein [Anaerolineae bacterium]
VPVEDEGYVRGQVISSNAGSRLSDPAYPRVLALTNPIYFKSNRTYAVEPVKPSRKLASSQKPLCNPSLTPNLASGKVNCVTPIFNLNLIFASSFFNLGLL